MGRDRGIPMSDFYLISELLKTMTVYEVAEKWEVERNSIVRFLAGHGTSANKIKHDFRVAFIREHEALGWKRKDMARAMNISVGYISTHYTKNKVASM